MVQAFQTEMNDVFMCKYNVLFVSISKNREAEGTNSNVIWWVTVRANLYGVVNPEGYKGERDKYWENNPMNPKVFETIKHHTS